MLANQSFLFPSSQDFNSLDDGFTNPKRKRRPAGTPDPDAEVVYLSPEMLMESDRYVCEICNQSFQREQNLQMHRRRHKVPWKLLKRDKQEVRKRVYVCPEPTCLHHDPSHALGDLVGIKKHFRRKHSNQKQFVCDKCSKGYAVQSDYKAHLKICGTKGHSCDCGRVFSRVETFIEHQDTCNARSTSIELEAHKQQPCMSKPSLNTSFSGNSNFFTNSLPDSTVPMFQAQHNHNSNHNHSSSSLYHNLDLGLELFSSNLSLSNHNNHVEGYETDFLGAKIQSREGNSLVDRTSKSLRNYYPKLIPGYFDDQSSTMEACRLKNEASQLLNIAMEHKALAEKRRHEAKCLIEMAKQDMTNARKIREQVFRDSVTCHACNKVLQTVSEDHQPAQMGNAKGNESFLLWMKELSSRR